MNYIIRRREKNDCYELAHIVTLTWNETYKGIINDEFLNNLYLNEDERGKSSTLRFNPNNNHKFVLLVENKIVGFINVDIADDPEFEKWGEIHALYILKEYHNMGLGKKLMQEGIKELKSLGCNKYIIGCLQNNPTNEFYKHMGGKFIKTRNFERLNMIENVYYFEV